MVDAATSGAMPAPVGGRLAEARLEDDGGAPRARAFDVEAMAADVDQPAGLRGGARTRGRTDGRDRATDGEDEERGDHRDDEPATTTAQLAPDLRDHPDRQDGQRRRPDPAQQVHDGRTRLDHDQAEPDRAEEHGGHCHPGLRLGAEAGRQDRHEAPAEPECEQDRPGDQWLRAARRRAEQQGDGKEGTGGERADDGEDGGAGARASLE